MEHNEHEMIKRFIKDNVELRKLYREHSNLENRLARYQTRTYLTSQEQVEQKRLKMKKLAGVEKMLVILADFRVDNAAELEPEVLSAA